MGKEKEREKLRIKHERKGQPGYDPDGDRLDGEEDEDMDNEGVFEDEIDLQADELIDGKPHEPHPDDKDCYEVQDGCEDPNAIDLDKFEMDDEGNYNFDGYDTDEMKDLLKSLRSDNAPKREQGLKQK